MAREKKNIENKTDKKPVKKGKSAFRKFKNRLSFLIVLAFAGFVFYMGWIQIRIPEGEYALVYTKTGGYDHYFIHPGQFVWRWENLFPENLTLHFIEQESRSADGHYSVFLPSGELYGDFIDRSDAFVSHFSWTFRYRLREESFISLVENGDFSFSALESLYESYEDQVQLSAAEYLKDRASDIETDPTAAAEEISGIVNKNNTLFDLESFRFTDLGLPDRALYEKTRELFLIHIEQLNKTERQAVQSAAVIESETEQKMKLLREYGEVFSKYPILLEYYGLDREKLDPSLFREAALPEESPES